VLFPVCLGPYKKQFFGRLRAKDNIRLYMQIEIYVFEASLPEFEQVFRAAFRKVRQAGFLS